MSTSNTTVIAGAVVTIVNPNKSVITLAPQSISVINTSNGVAYDLTEGADLIADEANAKVRVMSPTFQGTLANLSVTAQKAGAIKRRVIGRAI